MSVCQIERINLNDQKEKRILEWYKGNKEIQSKGLGEWYV